MNKIDVLTIEDLRLILAIVDKGSLTAGAASLQMGQSNASYSLKRIQGAFQADLFHRKGRTLVANEYGRHVYGHLREMLDDFQKVAHPPDFRPDREFALTFGATEYETHAVFPSILQFLNIAAPRARVRIKALSVEKISTLLEQLDFIFTPADISSDTVRTRQILADEYVTIYDSTCRDEPKSIDDFARARHAIVSFDGSLVSNVDRQLARHQLKREVVLSVFGFSALSRLIRGTDMITTLPKKIADGLFGDLSTCPCPLPLEPMPLFMCWEVAKEQHGKLRWFIENIPKMIGPQAKIGEPRSGK